MLMKVSLMLYTFICTNEEFVLKPHSDSPAAKSGDIALRPVAPAEDMAFARSCLSYCLREHSSCRFRGGTGYPHDAKPSLPKLPTRVVDVGRVGSPLSASLLETNSQQEEYLTLSYCWGKAEMTRTTSLTLSEHKKLICLDRLAKTVRDALAITKALGYRYIWIDSLCIIQDSISDWERESSQMAMIYRHSALTIAASGACSADEGCFLPRKPIPTVQLPYYTRERSQAGYVYVSKSLDMPTMYRDTVNGPLDRRAWTLQERFLSRRVLFYGKGCLHWSCDQRQCSETRHHRSELETYSYLGKPVNEFRRGLIKNERPWRGKKSGFQQVLYREWYRMIGEYTTRSLTYSGDKLPALSGLARNVAQHTGDRYAAGLWEEDFGFGVLWKGVGKRCVYDEFDLYYGPKYKKPRQWRAPSWSWASLDGETQYPDSSGGGKYEDAEPMLQDIKLHVQTSDVNKFGRVISGGVTLTGLLKEVKIVVGSHSTCDIKRKTYTEEEVMKSIETGISLGADEEQIPDEPCNLHDGFNSEMYDPCHQIVDSELSLTTDSELHVGCASIDEPEAMRALVGKKPLYMLLVQRVYHEPWKIGEGEGKGWYDCMGLALQRVGRKERGTVYRRVGMARLKEERDDYFDDVQRRRITIV